MVVATLRVNYALVFQSALRERLGTRTGRRAYLGRFHVVERKQPRGISMVLRAGTARGARGVARVARVASLVLRHRDGEGGSEHLAKTHESQQ